MEKQSLYIYKLDAHGNKVKFPNDTMPAKLGEYTYTAQRMAGTPTLTATLNYPTCLDEEWSGEEFVEFRGERYYVGQVPTSSKDNKSIMYKHELQFVSERIVLENVYFLDVVTDGADTYHSNSTTVKFMGDINEFVSRLNASMTKSGIGYSVVIDEDITSESKLVSLDNVYLAEALQSIYTIYDLPYYFVGKVCHIGYTENVISTPFEYRKGLISIKKTNANYKIVNRVTGLGSTENIPFYYPNDDATGTIERSQNLMPSIYRETGGAERFYNALNDTYKIPETNDYYTFKNTYSKNKVKEIKVDFSDIKPTIEGVTNASGQLFGEIAGIAFDANDSDELGTGEGNNVFNGTDEYVHSYFYIKLHVYNGKYGFNLFEQGLEGGTAVINMTTGNCAACEFEIGVTYNDSEPNRAFNPVLVDANGNLPAGDFEQKVTSQTSQYVERQQNTSTNEVWIAVKKDNTSFGVVMPNATNNYRPQIGDKFVITGIKMPKSLVIAAEDRLEEALIKYMSENNDEKFSFSLNFSRVFLSDNSSIAAILNENARMYIKYNDKEYLMYVNSFTCKADKNCLYDISVELTDKLSANVSSLRSTITEIAGNIIGSTLGGNNISTTDILAKVSRYFLSKTHDDRTPYKLSSDTAFEVGKFVSGSTGGIIMVDKETGQTYAEVDKLKVRMKAYFESLEIQDVNSVGGKILLTPGGAVTLIDVWTKGTIEQTPILSMADGNPILLADGSELQLMDKEAVDNGVPEGVYRCFFLAEQDGVEVENRFRAGFQVQSKNFNIQKPGEYQQVANHYYWRLCVGASKEPINVGIYKLHYIDLSMADCDTGSDIPAKGDTVAHLGARIKWKGIDNKDVTDESNIDAQNAIVFSSTDVFSPSVTLYHGIDSYSYLNKEYVEYGVDKTNNKAFFHVYGDAYIGDRDGNSFVKFTQGEGVELKGKLHIQEGSTGSANLTDLPDEIYNAVQIGNENLLLNSGFTGDYDSIDISESTQMQADTEVYSPKIKYWEGDANIVEDSEAVSGYRADIGYLSQEVNLMLEEQYVISLRAKGTSLTVGYGDYNSTESLDDTYKKYVYKFTCRSLGVFFISGKASVCDIKLERGTIPTDWCPSRLDTDKSADRFKYLQYIQDAIKDGSVDILGGLILANMIQLGNYKNGKLQKVTAGISGIYNDDDDVAFWAGGTLQQAMRTIARLKSNPDYSPSDSEWGNLAKFIATHGGDIFLKGYIYAVGGLFRGRVETAIDGKRIVIDPVSKTLKMFTAEGNETVTMRFDRSEEGYEYGDIILKKYSSNNEELLKTTVYPERIRIENKVEKTDILIAPENVTVIGGNGEVMRVGMKAVYSDISSRHYISDLFSSNWPTSEDSVETGGVYMTSIPIGDSIISGVLRVKK